jgi:hypothetical protein
MGSVVVAGIHFDQRTAKTVVNAEGAPVAWQDLDVGMMLEIEAGAVMTMVDGESAQSSAIRVTSDLLGPVTAIEGSGSQITMRVMGQPVRVDASTLLRRKAGGAWQTIGLGDFALNDIVEVYGFQDVAAQRYVATRIERKNPTDAVPHYVVRGVIKDLTLAGCRIGAQEIAYVWSPMPANLREGRVARAKLYPAQIGAGWQAVAMEVSEPLVKNGGHARLDGLITERLSDTALSVNGVAVQLGSACAGCVEGARVNVRGAIENGVLKGSLTLSP